MFGLKYRIKVWKEWKKHYIGFTCAYGVLVFLGIIHSPTFDRIYVYMKYWQ